MMKQVKFTMPRRALTLACGLALTATAFGQQVVVKGHVKDASGEPVIGATVRAAGQQGGTVTDLDGNFTLNVPAGSTLSISYIGYLEATATASSNLTVTLEEENKSLNEVVVIGYGRAKKSDVTGSVTAIKPDDMSHGLNTNPQDMIQGKIAGVNIMSNDGTPGGGATIRVRGGSSLNASNDPLIVIDGLAMDSYGVQGLSNPLSSVNPNDIESFTVLKDASATAIYGSRASNGVIIITTKKGRAGSKPQITYSGNMTISAPRKTLDVLDGPAFKEFVGKLYGTDSDAYKSLGYTDANGNKVYANTDWQDEVYRTSFSTDQSITVSGGLKNMPYRVSLGYTNQGGIVKTSNFKRYTASVSLSPVLLDDHLRINANAKGMLAKNRYADGGAISAARFMDPTKPVKADNDIYNNYFDGYGQWYSDANYDGDSNWLYTNNTNATKNPLAMLRQNRKKAISKTLMGNLELDYAIHGFEDLHLHVNGSANLATGEENTSISPFSGTNNYYGYTRQDTKDTYTLQFQSYAQYLKDFGGSKDNPTHHIDVMAGYEYSRYHQESDWLSYGLYPMSNTLHAGEYFEYRPAEGKTNVYKSENYLVSYYGRMNYSLLSRYLLTFTLRNDNSSRFPKASRAAWYPSVALGWRINEEPFMKNIEAISDFKLRLGWGITGQQDGIGDYTYIATYKPNSNIQGTYPIIGDGTTYRPDAVTSLRWEKTTTWNAGIDLSLFNDRLTFTLDGYYRKTKDLLNTTYVAAMSNFATKVMKNIGSLHNMGIEFATTVRPIQTKDLRWELNYNVTYNKNEIDKLDEAGSPDYLVETGRISAGTGGNIQAYAVGRATRAFLVYQQVYDKSGKPVPNTFVDRNGNGSIDSGDRYYYYKQDPDVTMGFGSKLMYKNWDFSFNMRANLGNYVYNNTLAGMLNTGRGAIYTLGYVQNRDARSIDLGFTSPSSEQFFSDYFVQNASFLKMDNISLGYSFARLWDYNISGRIYTTVQNVFTITNYDGLDPEVGGIDNNPYPRPIQFIVGLNLNF